MLKKTCLEISEKMTIQFIQTYKVLTQLQSKFLSFVFFSVFSTIPRGLMARIPGFHPGGPGSIPGVGV